ncbi:Dihydrosphingosine phosphate lyase [Saccharomyces pastorianus]|uniref:sphinganine-1-phosphate aldolase n=1 Tax=Saccharomyces pastorianus TaxID=27292 RepID=A0A6C1DQA3_SACPS|nr:Dihydrosphingosine phosphate lyase [Saccharomyces pastorianus]
MSGVSNKTVSINGWYGMPIHLLREEGDFAQFMILTINELKIAIHGYLRNTPWYNMLKDYLFVIFCYKLISNFFYLLKVYGPVRLAVRTYEHSSRRLFRWLLDSPFLRGTVEKEVTKVKQSIEDELIRSDSQLMNFPQLPSNGIPQDDVIEELNKLNDLIPHTQWKEGKVSGAVYHGGDDLIHLQTIAYEKYCVANQLHPDVFPAVRKMESEVVSMVLRMFNAPSDTGCGTTTSGGTESLLLACLSAKMYALHHRGITEPEIIAPVTAHAGFDKAAYYFGMKLRHVELDPTTYQVDLGKVKKFINKNTVLLVGSAPNFPHGIADDIEGLGKIAQKYKLPLHVDSCLGSFIVSFMEKAGYKHLPLLDFRVPGVTSISCDTHKYGFAPKGSSVIMYRNSDLRMHQYYVNPAWTGGLYGSPTLAGSRPGAIVVGCWATMVNMGENGYIESCQEIVGAAMKFKKYIQENIPDLNIMGNPRYSVISFSSKTLNIHELSDRLSKKGWHFNALQKPVALHMAFTRLSAHVVDEICDILRTTVQELKSESNSKPSPDGTSALYGVAGSVKTAGVADKLIVGFLDALYKLGPGEDTATK